MSHISDTGGVSRLHSFSFLCKFRLFRLSLSCVLVSIKFLIGLLSTLGNISFTAECTQTNTSTKSIPCTIGSINLARSAHHTVTLSKDF